MLQNLAQESEGLPPVLQRPRNGRRKSGLIGRRSKTSKMALPDGGKAAHVTERVSQELSEIGVGETGSVVRSRNRDDRPNPSSNLARIARAPTEGLVLGE